MKKTTLIAICLILFKMEASAQVPYYPLTAPGAGASITTGTDNFFFGKNAGNSTNTGSFNSFFGIESGKNNTTASGNSFFGGFSGFSNTTGTGNLFLGNAAGYYNTTGSSNSFVGSESGLFNTTGASNSFFGFQSGRANTTGSSNTFIGRETGKSNTTGSFNFFAGNQAGQFNTTGYENTFVGYLAGHQNTSGRNNVFVGKSTGQNNTTGIDNLFIGGHAGITNTSGSNNIFLGSNAGFNNTSAINNTFIGTAAGFNNTVGERNLFLGVNAGFSNTSGSDNIFSGHRSGYNNTTGFENLFSGLESGLSNTSGNQNVFSGVYSGYFNSTGSFNTFLGWQAGSTNTTGSSNTCIGWQAGTTNGNGGNNTFLGVSADVGSIGLNFATAIGSQALVNSSNTLALGGTGPATQVVIINKTSSSGLAFNLEVNGAAMNNTGIWTISDKQFKREIKDYKNALDVITKLRPVSYYFKENLYYPQMNGDKTEPVKRNLPTEEQIGFIAQELEEILPNMVRTDKYGFKVVCHDKLFGVIVQGIKEQDTKITTSEEKIQTLEAQNKQLTERLELLNAMVLAQQNNKPAIEVGKNKTEMQETARIESVNPNPFGSSTNIAFDIPTAFSNARLTIVSETGNEVAKIAIKEQGKGNFVFTSDILKAGSFYAYLTVDEVVVDYRKIILIK